MRKEGEENAMIEINDLIGVPYKDHGRDKTGYDCYGLCIEVARRAGYRLDDVYYEDHALALSRAYAPTLNVHKIEAPCEGALLEMETHTEAGTELHIGICLNETEFIHTTRLGCRVNRIGTFKVRGIYGIDTRL